MGELSSLPASQWQRWTEINRSQPPSRQGEGTRSVGPLGAQRDVVLPFPLCFSVEQSSCRPLSPTLITAGWTWLCKRCCRSYSLETSASCFCSSVSESLAGVGLKFVENCPGFSQNPTVVWYHLMSLPGAEQRTLGLMRRKWCPVEKTWGRGKHLALVHYLKVDCEHFGTWITVFFVHFCC